MDIITRQEAIDAGLKLYFTGNPCKHGHVSEWFICGRCRECSREKDHKYHAAHSEARCEKARKWNAANSEAYRENVRKWRASNPEAAKKHDRKRYAAKPEARREHVRKWQVANPGKVNEASRRRDAEQLQRTPPWFDAAKVLPFYEFAASLTKQTGVPHHVDHVIPLRGRLVSGLHVAENLQVLTGSDNCKKRNKFVIT